MNIEEKYSALTYLFRCYFNQDFEVLFGNADETLEAYKSTETVDEQSKMKAEIVQLLSLSLDENELQNILLNDMDCNYYYPNEWCSSHEWLRHIFNRLN